MEAQPLLAVVDHKPAPAPPCCCCRRVRCCWCCCRIPRWGCVLLSIAAVLCVLATAATCVYFLVIHKHVPEYFPPSGPCPPVRRHACPFPREAERYRAPDGVPPSHEHLAITAVGPGEVSLCWPTAPNQGNYTLQATNWWLESSEFTTVYVGARPAATLDASAALPVPIIAGGSYAFRVGDGSDAFTKPLTVALPSCGLCDSATDLTTLRSERGSFKSTVHGCILGCFFGSSCITSCVHKDLQLSSNCSACVAGLAGCMKDHCFGNCVTSPTGSPCRDCLWSECLPQASNCTGIPKRVLFDLFQGSG